MDDDIIYFFNIEDYAGVVNYSTLVKSVGVYVYRRLLLKGFTFAYRSWV